MGRISLTSLVLSAVLAAGASGCGGSSHTSSSPTAKVSEEPHPEATVNPLFSRSYPPAPAREQTHPSISPPSGTTKATFTVRLTTHHQLGLTTPVRYAYFILARGPHPRCSVFTELTIAKSGARAPVSLQAPIERGWCLGTFEGEVLLQTSPSCGPSPGAAHTRCDVFAPRFAEAGRFRFTTR